MLRGEYTFMYVYERVKAGTQWSKLSSLQAIKKSNKLQVEGKKEWTKF